MTFVFVYTAIVQEIIVAIFCLVQTGISVKQDTLA